MKKLFLFATAAALTVSSAVASANYRVTFFQPSFIAGQELKPGDYRVEVDNGKATIKSGKTSIEAEVRVVESNEKFTSTTVRYQNGDGKYRVQEIRLGGTKTKLVFSN